MNQYPDRAELKKYLDILFLIDMILTPPEDDCLRLINKGITEDGILKELH